MSKTLLQIKLFGGTLQKSYFETLHQMPIKARVTESFLSKTSRKKGSGNSIMHNVEKWLNILLKSYGVHTARFLKYVSHFPTFCMKGLETLLVDY